MSMTHHFRDFDAFAHSVRGIECVMMFQNPTSRTWSISGVDLAGIRVQQGWLGSGNIVEGQSYSDGHIFYIPLTNAIEYSANGRILEKNAIAHLEPGCEFCISTKVAHDWCSVFVPTHQFARGGDLGEPSSGSEKMTCRVTRPNLQVANQFRTVASQIMTVAAHCSQFESAPAATCAATELLNLTSLVAGKRQAGAPHQKGRPRFSRQEIVRRCQEQLEERDGELVHLEELAAAADVSERTLRTAFNEYFGIGPVRYLQLRQLHRVNRALKASDPEAKSVTSVLVEQGVWEFSRFASRYRRLFGELPSETLRTKRR
jgi:AraC family ethanolamine operon transcriptional activator